MYESMSLIEFLQASPGIIIFMMFSLLMALMLTGQRVFGVMGFVGVVFALIFVDRGALGYGFNAAIKLFNWYPMLTLPICSLIATRMNGTLSLDESYTKGARFVLELHT